jgi:hypothetical protein
MAAYWCSIYQAVSAPDRTSGRPAGGPRYAAGPEGAGCQSSGGTGERDGRGLFGGPARPGEGTPTGQQASAHTMRPGCASAQPQRLVQAATMASPRPPSASRSKPAAAGIVALPASVTATLATPSRGQATSTANTPPSPEAVCSIAFAQNSDTQVTRTSLAGQPARISATNLRASGTAAGVPRKVRAQVPRGRADPAEPEDPVDPQEPK